MNDPVLFDRGPRDGSRGSGTRSAREHLTATAAARPTVEGVAEHEGDGSLLKRLVVNIPTSLLRVESAQEGAWMRIKRLKLTRHSPILPPALPSGGRIGPFQLRSQPVARSSAASPWGPGGASGTD
jgi:hypothetical protein